VITRIVGDLIDLSLAAQRWWTGLQAEGRPARNAWRALPGDLAGLAVMRLCGGLRPSREVSRPNGPPALLVEDPRAARYLDHVPLKPYAQTLGRYILARGRLPDQTIRHELEHVGQWSRLGPLFLPVYGAASLVAVLAGRNRYFDNVFEIAARAREPETWPPNARDLESG
jgi:hypothetical protein